MRSSPAAQRVVFFGTSSFAVPSLRVLTDAHEVVAVVTQPDRPAGRGLKTTPSPVKVAALERSLRVSTPERLDRAFIDEIAALEPQVLACASYGKILPRSLLAIAGMAPLNVHPSLLPQLRGATPIQTALREGRTSTGVTIIWMSERMDAGDVVLQRPEHIAETDDYGALHDRLAAAGADLLANAVQLNTAGELPRTPQDESHASYTRPIAKEDLRISADDSADAVVNLVRSVSPSPGAWLLWGGKRLKVLRARAEPADAPELSSDGPALRVRDGVVRLLRVVPEGRKPMSGAEFARLSSSRP